MKGKGNKMQQAISSFNIGGSSSSLTGNDSL